MPDSFDPKDSLDNSPKKNPVDADSAGTPSPETSEQHRAASRVPLPDFDAGDEDELSETSVKMSPAHPPTLRTFITTGEANQEQESAPASSKGIYQVSSAEPDWPDYRFSTLEDEPDSTQEDTGSGWKTAWAVLREVGETIILTLIIFLLIQTVIRNFRVVGTSMVENLHDGQYLIIDKLSYNPLITDVLGMGGPKRGDVVVFEPPNRPAEDYVKRVVALPGETVEIKRGQVLINGQPLAEPFQPNTGSYSMPPRMVPEGQVFVLGDNRNNSNDSHNWGPLPVENIVGRAWLSYWPPDRWGTISRNAPTEQTTLKYLLEELVPRANANSE